MDKTIFISNLHSAQQTDQILDLFSQFGQITLCHLFCNKYKKCRGFGLITYSSKKELRSSLQAKIWSMGRQIRVSEYIQDNQKLGQADAELSKLKICVLGIPKLLTDDLLNQIFTRAFGPVQHCYITDDPKKKKNIGFVTFQTNYQVDQALSKRTVKIGKSETLSLKKFQVKTKHKINLEKLMKESNLVFPSEPPQNQRSQNRELKDPNTGHISRSHVHGLTWDSYTPYPNKNKQFVNSIPTGTFQNSRQSITEQYLSQFNSEQYNQAANDNWNRKKRPGKVFSHEQTSQPSPANLTKAQFVPYQNNNQGQVNSPNSVSQWQIPDDSSRKRRQLQPEKLDFRHKQETLGGDSTLTSIQKISKDSLNHSAQNIRLNKKKSNSNINYYPSKVERNNFPYRVAKY